MRKKPKLKDSIPLFIIVSIMLVYLILKLAPYGDLYTILENYSEALNQPFHFEAESVRYALFGEIIWFFLWLAYATDRKFYMRGEEHGTAEWADVGHINRKYKSKNVMDDKLFTEHVSMSYNDRKTDRNMLSMVVGGSGAGKSFRYVKPNLMQCNTSFFVLDPKGENLRDTGYLLKKNGYEIRVLDLINMSKSDGYNPFKYIMSETDVSKIATAIFKATEGKGGGNGDNKFWDETAKMELMSYIYYLIDEVPESEQNFATVMLLLRNDGIDEKNPKQPSPFGELIDRLERFNPNHPAVKNYRNYRTGAVKTIQSIQITLAARLYMFDIEELANLTKYDEMDLPSLGEKKVALFALIPDSDTTFNFLVSILYIQLFQHLFHAADFKYGGKLPVRVHLLMDEFANVSLPDDFEKMVATMRSRNVSVSIILQNMAQLKALFEKCWESIEGNCDEFLYLGGNEASTHKYISEKIGNATIDTNTYGLSYGKNGSSSKNDQNTGRALMTPEQVREMDRNYCVLFISGEKAVYDRKIQTLEHPNVDFTPLKGNKDLIYRHGEVDMPHSDLEIVTDETDADNSYDYDTEDVSMAVITSSDIIKYIKKEKTK